MAKKIGTVAIKEQGKSEPLSLSVHNTKKDPIISMIRPFCMIISYRVKNWKKKISECKIN